MISSRSLGARRRATFVSAGIATASIASLLLPVGAVSAAPVSATRGLYGQSDPTFDGVFRQSMAVIALDKAGRRPHASSISWLTGQQCADGSFMPYRANTAAACIEYDPKTYVGKDTNATALAAIALQAVGENRRAQKAATWLLGKQNDDGGWAMNPGSEFSASDANSTGLVIAALKAVRAADATGASVHSHEAWRGGVFLKGLQSRCAATVTDATRGGLAFDGASKAAGPNAMASAQAAMGLVGALNDPKISAYVRTRSGVRKATLQGSRWSITYAGRTGTASYDAKSIKIGRTTYVLRRSVVAPKAIPASATVVVCGGKTITSVPNGVLGWLSRSITAGKGGLPDSYMPGQKDNASTGYALIALGRAKVATPAIATGLKYLSGQAATWVAKNGVDDAGRLAVLALTAEATGKNPNAFGGVKVLDRIAASRRA